MGEKKVADEKKGRISLADLVGLNVLASSWTPIICTAEDKGLTILAFGNARRWGGHETVPCA